MLAAVLGIEGPWIWMGYVLCIASALLCVVYALAARNAKADDETPAPQDAAWAKRDDF